MPRTGRIIFDNAVYHIFNRGHDRRRLFCEPDDFGTFKDMILRYKQKYQFDLYHYCLMANHFHLLLKIAKGSDLSMLMKGICQSYAFYYKRERSFSGYLFQNRYKSILIEKDEYLMECGRYIELNPVRANIVDTPGKYYWSSYNFYSKDEASNIITTDPLYIALSAIDVERKKKYIEYVDTPRPYEQLLDEKISELK
jgi:putative transposase